MIFTVGFPINKSIPKSKIFTFFGLPINSALLQRASFIFPSPNRTFRTPWSSFEKFSITNFFIKYHCISPRYESSYLTHENDSYSSNIIFLFFYLGQKPTTPSMGLFWFGSRFVSLAKTPIFLAHLSRVFPRDKKAGCHFVKPSLVRRS